MHNWFKSYSNFAEWVDVASWWRCFGKGLRLQHADQDCFLLLTNFYWYAWYYLGTHIGAFLSLIFNNICKSFLFFVCSVPIMLTQSTSWPQICLCVLNNNKLYVAIKHGHKIICLFVKSILFSCKGRGHFTDPRTLWILDWIGLGDISVVCFSKI